MRKLFTLLLICIVSASSLQAQTCEERKTKLLEVAGSLSSTLIYNTYIVIGSVADGSYHKVYDSTHTIELMDEQIGMLEVNSKMFDEMIKEKTLEDEGDKSYVIKINAIFKGLKEQAGLLKKYVTDKKQTTATSFDNKRVDNWAKIKDIMGFE